MPFTLQLYATGLIVFILGTVTGAACHFWARSVGRVSTFLCGAALVGALLEAGAAIGGLLGGSDLVWTIPSGLYRV